MTDLLHPLIDALHDAARDRGHRPAGLLDLARVMAERRRVPAKATVASLTTAFRAQNGVKVVEMCALARDAYAQAARRAGALDQALGTVTRRRARPRPAPACQRLLAIKVSIRDRDAIERLDVAAVARYLQAAGWRRWADTHRPFHRADAVPTGSEWRKGSISALLPAADVTDRVARLSDLLQALEADERRSQLLIYRDLLAA